MINLRPAPDAGQHRSFWTLFRLVVGPVLGAGLFFALGEARVGLVLSALGIFFLLIALLVPFSLRALDRAMLVLVHEVGSFLTLSSSLTLWWTLFVPGRVVLHLLRVDPLQRDFPSKERSFWVTRAPGRPADSLRRQF